MGFDWFPRIAKKPLCPRLDRLRWIPGAAPELGADGSGILRRTMSLPVALDTNVPVRLIDASAACFVPITVALELEWVLRGARLRS